MHMPLATVIEGNRKVIFVSVLISSSAWKEVIFYIQKKFRIIKAYLQ